MSGRGVGGRRRARARVGDEVVFLLAVLWWCAPVVGWGFVAWCICQIQLWRIVVRWDGCCFPCGVVLRSDEDYYLLLQHLSFLKSRVPKANC